MGPRLKVSSEGLDKSRIEPTTPGLQRMPKRLLHINASSADLAQAAH